MSTYSILCKLACGDEIIDDNCRCELEVWKISHYSKHLEGEGILTPSRPLPIMKIFNETFFINKPKNYSLKINPPVLIECEMTSEIPIYFDPIDSSSSMNSYFKTGKQS